MDTLLFYLPALAYALYRERSMKGALAVIAGFFPVLLWEVFSLFYYGTPFPNTAYAKLNTGMERAWLIEHGGDYFLDSLRRDYVTLTAIAVGTVLPIQSKYRRAAAVSAGIAAYLSYVLFIGGDFMSGRFFTAPLFCAVVLIPVHRPSLKSRVFFPAFFAVICLGLLSPHTPLLSSSDYGLHMKDAEVINRRTGIADERAVYYQATGLLSAMRETPFPYHDNVRAGWHLRAGDPSGHQGIRSLRGRLMVVEGTTNGFLSFYAGPKVHILDLFALGDPLLARLPAQKGSRVRHFRREVSKGYMETLSSGENRIVHKGLAAYFDKLALVTKGELFDASRLREIWHMNTSRYNHLVGGDAS